MTVALAATFLGWACCILVMRSYWVDRKLKEARSEIRDLENEVIQLRRERNHARDQVEDKDLTIEAMREGMAVLEARLSRIKTIAEGRGEIKD